MKWWDGLSVRSANVIMNHYRFKKDEITPIDFQNTSQNMVKYILTNDIENGKVKLLWMRNCGRKSAEEIMLWLELMPHPLYAKPKMDLIRMIDKLQKENEQLQWAVKNKDCLDSLRMEV